MRILKLLTLLVASHLGIVAQSGTIIGGLTTDTIYFCEGHATDKPCTAIRPLAEYTDAELVQEFSRRAASKGLSPTQTAISLRCQGDGSCEYSTTQTVKPSTGSTGIFFVPAGSGTLTSPNIPLFTN